MKHLQTYLLVACLACATSLKQSTPLSLLLTPPTLPYIPSMAVDWLVNLAPVFSFPKVRNTSDKV